MRHTIELTTRDGAQLSFDCADDQTVLAAAAAAHISLPAQCRQGSCGACYAEVKHGDYQLGEHSPAALPTEKSQRGGVLLCCTQARSDLQISLPLNRDRIVIGEIARRPAVIDAIETIASHTVRVSLSLLPDEAGDGAMFEPGQFMELEVPDLNLKRAYSLSNISNWENRLEFLIRLQPGGCFSNWLQDHAQVGHVILVHGPQGAFGLNSNSLRPRWLVAGGTGLAPMLSMLRSMAELQDSLPVRLYFGVNHEDELFCLQELRDLQAQLPQLSVTLCVWKPQSAWGGFCGTPADAVAADLAAGQVSPDIYLCGPPALINAVESLARQHGIPESQVLSERFLPA